MHTPTSHRSFSSSSCPFIFKVPKSFFFVGGEGEGVGMKLLRFVVVVGTIGSSSVGITGIGFELWFGSF